MATRPRNAGDSPSKGGSEQPTNSFEEDEAIGERIFPSGLAAIRDTGPRDRVWLVNVSLKEVLLPVSDEKRLNSTDAEVRRTARPIPEKIKPFGALEVPSDDAKRALSAFERPGGPMDTPLLVQAPEGNCRGKHEFVDGGRDTGRPEVRFGTCPYIECPQHPAPNRLVERISIRQSQHRVAKLGTIPAIERWIQTDGRIEVMQWGHHIIGRRRRQREEDLGIGVGNLASRVATY